MAGDGRKHRYNTQWDNMDFRDNPKNEGWEPDTTFQWFPLISNEDKELITLVGWEKWKEKGNSKFKEMDYNGAIEEYSWAAKLTDPTFARWWVFVQGRHARIGATSFVRILDEPSLKYILKILRDWEGNAMAKNNEAAAICHANISLAYMKIGNNQAALQAAATAVCFRPSYLKGQFRRWKALSLIALQYGEEESASVMEAFEHSQCTFKKMFPCPYSWEGSELFALGLIEKNYFIFSQSIRYEGILNYLSEILDLSAWSGVMVLSTLLPFPHHIGQNDWGQWLSVDLQYALPNGKLKRIPKLQLIELDDRNGNDIDSDNHACAIACDFVLHKAGSALQGLLKVLYNFDIPVIDLFVGQGLAPLADPEHPLYFKDDHYNNPVRSDEIYWKRYVQNGKRASHTHTGCSIHECSWR